MTRGWLGVQIQPVSAGIADSLGMKKAEGAIVDSAQPAARPLRPALQPGDVITAVNGTSVKDARELARQVAGLTPDSSVKLDVLHNGETRSVSVTLGRMPDQQQANAGNTQQQPTNGVPHLGLRVAPAD